MFLQQAPETKLHSLLRDESCSIALYWKHVQGTESSPNTRGHPVQGQVAATCVSDKITRSARPRNKQQGVVAEKCAKCVHTPGNAVDVCPTVVRLRCNAMFVCNKFAHECTYASV